MTLRRTITLCLLFIAPLAWGSSAPPAVPSLAPMLKKVMPSVVNIVVRGVAPQYPSARRFPQEQTPQDYARRRRGPQPFVELGSGVIVDAKHGYLLTNNHLIRNAKTITVKLNGGRKFKAKLIGKDSLSDLAVLQIHADHLKAIRRVDSSQLKVGDFVAAIGSPFGFSQTVTSGIVSALQRTHLELDGPQSYENFIQTDASINPGNSGGALVNLNGELVGINTAIYTPVGANVGIGFAIPTNMAYSVMEQLVKHGSMQRGIVGIMVQKLTPELAAALNESFVAGSLVTQITPDSPADQAGLKVGDIIHRVNGVLVDNAATVRNTIGLERAGSTIQLDIIRKGQKKKVHFKTVDPKKIEARIIKAKRFLFGLGLDNFDQQTPIQGHIRGVLITHIAENSPAWNAGLHPGDVVVSANRKPVDTLAALQQHASEAKNYLLLNVKRGGGALFIPVKAYS